MVTGTIIIAPTIRIAPTISTAPTIIVSDCVKPISQWGTVGEREKGMGRKGEGGQYTANQGSEWMGIAPRHKGGIPSK